MKEKKTTGTLTSILKQARPQDLDAYLEEHADSFLGEKPFAAFMHGILAKKELKQREVFLAADIPEGYGYKLLSEEKHTRQRDLIIRLCLASRMDLKEAERALQLSGMPALYAKDPRDAVFVIALNRGVYRIDAVDEMLSSHGLERLQTCGKQD